MKLTKTNLLIKLMEIMKVIFKNNKDIYIYMFLKINIVNYI